MSIFTRLIIILACWFISSTSAASAFRCYKKEEYERAGIGLTFAIMFSMLLFKLIVLTEV